jgi:hypothetical protein
MRTINLTATFLPNADIAITTLENDAGNAQHRPLAIDHNQPLTEAAKSLGLSTKATLGELLRAMSAAPTKSDEPLM